MADAYPTSETSTASPPPPPFTHLHVHTEYSLIDGTIRTGQLVKKAKQWGHTAIAMTDSGNLFGAVEFYSKAKAEGVKAIIGSEIYFEGHPLTLKLAADRGKAYPECGAYHLVLLCKNNQGYKNLCKIVSAGYTEGLRDVPIVKTSHLAAWPGDMIALSGDMMSELAFLVSELRRLQERGALDFSSTEDADAQVIAAIREHIDAVHTYVGHGNYYVELIDNQLAPQRQWPGRIGLALAKSFTGGSALLTLCGSYFR